MLQKVLILLVALLAIGGGLVFWKTYYYKPHGGGLTELTASDIELILKDAPPQALQQLATDPEAKKEILDSLRETLALAAEARHEGIADQPAVKRQLNFIEQQIVALNWDKRQNKGQPAPPLGSISPEDTQKYLDTPGNMEQFQATIDAAKESGAFPKEAKLEGEQLTQLQQQWAKLMIAYERGKEELKTLDPDEKRKTELQVALQQASFLARKYSEELAKKVEPTKEEIDAYLKEHPEYDPAKKKEMAEQILQRVKGGEDFAKLADEFTEDPGNKDPKTGKGKGGLYENIGKGQFDPAFEAAALSLEPGQVNNTLVETQFGYHIIKLEGKKTEKGKDGKDEVKYNVRHILLSNTSRDPQNPFSPPMPLADKAKNDLEAKKRDELLKEIVARNHIKIAEDFKVEVPDTTQMPQMPGMPPDLEDSDEKTPEKTTDKTPPVKKDEKTTDKEKTPTDKKDEKPAKK
jgi:hypothetical protein